MGTSGSPEFAELPSEIRAYRYLKRLTQTQLARRLGVTQQTVARWEHGLAPRADLLVRIKAEIEAGQDDLAEVVPFAHWAGDEDLSPSDDEDLKRRFVETSIKKLERGDRVPESVWNLIAEYFESKR